MVRQLQVSLLVLLYAHAITTAFTYRDISTKASISHIDASVDFPSDNGLLSSSSSSQSLLHHHSLTSSSLSWSKRSSSVKHNIFNRRYCCLVLQATPTSGDNKGSGGGGGGGKKKGSGYRFGDLTKSLLGGSVEKITGKPYEFGDLSRAVDSSIKDKINDLTGNDDYEFGDLSRWVDTNIKGEVNKFTEKESYQFGDMTKEIVKRVASGKYTLDDLFMLLKGLAILGTSLSPVAGFLPVKLLVELLNFSLLNDVAGKVTSSLAMELDKRLKKSLLGDEDYKLGDATKRTIASAVQSYTGKDSYEFGDVTKKVVSAFSDDVTDAKERQKFGEMKSASSEKDIEPSLVEALDKWDSASEKQLQDGLDKLEEYVELVEKEQKLEKKK